MSSSTEGKAKTEISSDNELAQRVLRGEVDAYRAIVERHQARIFYLGLKFLRRPEDAEDFAQEVFCRVYEKLASFQGGVPFAAWLYRIAFNLAVNRYHVKKRAVHSVATVDLLPDFSLSPEHRLLREELAEWVRKTLHKIPKIYHVLIRMHFFEGLSYPEISKALEMPVNTIKSYIFRAKELIRQKHLSWEGGVAHG
jgi:RNA polymerase sigma-70 factor (ECF subfamily)